MKRLFVVVLLLLLVALPAQPVAAEIVVNFWNNFKVVAMASSCPLWYRISTKRTLISGWK